MIRGAKRLPFFMIAVCYFSFFIAIGKNEVSNDSRLFSVFLCSLLMGMAGGNQ